MKIIQLTAENVKRLTVVQITPKGNVVVIGGKNGSGKTSVLDSIMYGLAGADVIPEKPIRKGQTKGRVELDLGDIVVKRTFTAGGGGQVTVKDKDGVPQSSPQAILDKLCARIAFDPLEFANQKPDKQSETLRQLLGLDFKVEDAEIKRLAEERTVVNREMKSVQTRLLAITEYLDVTETEEKSAAEIMAEQSQAAEQNQKNASVRAKAKEIRGSLTTAEKDLQVGVNHIAELRAKLIAAEEHEKTLRDQIEAARTRVEQAEQQAAALVDTDLKPFQDRAATIEQTNAKVRSNKAKKELREQARAKEKESETLTAKIEETEGKKRTTLAEAKFPVPGLGLDDVGNVTFDGIPFKESNTASQIRVSVAIGLALNKTLKVLLIRQGSELDPESRQLIAEMAEAADAQVWIETSRTDAPVSVVMEDGHATEQPEKAAEPEQPQLV